VALRGEFDLSTGPDLSDTLAQAIASRAGDVAVDLAGVRFMDSAFVGAVALAHHQLLDRQDRTLTFRSPSNSPPAFCICSGQPV
jgi:anti-anti-sigma factor